MRIKTMHIQGFDDSRPVCGAAGRASGAGRTGTTPTTTPNSNGARCEKKLGAAHRAGKDDAEKKAPSRVSSYPISSVEAAEYARGYDADAIERLPPKPAIRTVSPGYAEFLMTLEAAKRRTHDYSNKERATITRAINRANRSLANRPTPCGRSCGPVTERKGINGPITREFTATCTLPAGHAGCHEDKNEPTAVGRPFSWGDPFRRAGAAD